jgi:hypothetical protein
MMGAMAEGSRPLSARVVLLIVAGAGVLVAGALYAHGDLNRLLSYLGVLLLVSFGAIVVVGAFLGSLRRVWPWLLGS